jgi:DNA-binding response OmpR family regulator
LKLVLVIEDNPDLSQLFSTILSLAGFKVEVAYTGNDGLMRLEQSMPDAIVLDMHLPGVSGCTIYQMLDEQHQAFRVLVCSADVGLVEEYKSKGANAMAKPIAIDDLREAVTRIVNQAIAV